MPSHKKHTVVLVNLGSPDEPTPAAVRKFLAEFLADRRVVEIPRLLWLCILYCFILTFRPKRVSKLYASIWCKEGSPLTVYTKKLARKVEVALASRYGESAPAVYHAMTYGGDNLVSVLDRIKPASADRIIIVPLYPQYSATTTGAVYDQIAGIIQNRRDIPDFRVIKHYYDKPAYTEALATSVREHWQQHGESNKLLFSYHGIPQRNVDMGDPYQAQCIATTEKVVESLGLSKERWEVAFQSRFGPAQWIEPATDKTLQVLGEQGMEGVDVICPAFAVDCLETLEEIAVTNREIFEQSGGKNYRYIPCLNDSDQQVELMMNLIAEEL